MPADVLREVTLFLERCLRFAADLDLPGWLITFWAFFFVDLPRDLFAQATAAALALFRRPAPPRDASAGTPPRLSVVLPALNEEKTIGHTVLSLLEQRYPGLEIIVVDDGSTDGTPEICGRLERAGHIRFFRFEERQGKSAALNYGTRLATSEVVVLMDTDTTLDRGSLARIAEEISRPGTAAVAGDVGVRNARENLLTRLQAVEYLWSITLGRVATAHAGLLTIVSGAFGAFRRDELARVGGNDPGPDNDSDLTLRLRKLGGRIAFLPGARCLTNVPTGAAALVRQRRRWSRSVIRTFARKHAQEYDGRQRGFRWKNLIALLDCVLYEGAVSVLWVAYLLQILLGGNPDLPCVLALAYGLYLSTDALRFAVALGTAPRARADWRLGWVLPLMPFYRLGLKLIQLWAMIEELLFRASYRDPFAPRKVREEMIVW